MPILYFILLLIGIGVALYLIPMDPGIKRIAVIVTAVVAGVLLLVWVLQVTGIGTGPKMRIGGYTWNTLSSLC